MYLSHIFGPLECKALPGLLQSIFSCIFVGKYPKIKNAILVDPQIWQFKESFELLNGLLRTKT
jgi:hypothetical protein